MLLLQIWLNYYTVLTQLGWALICIAMRQTFWPLSPLIDFDTKAISKIWKCNVLKLLWSICPILKNYFWWTWLMINNTVTFPSIFFSSTVELMKNEDTKHCDTETQSRPDITRKGECFILSICGICWVHYSYTCIVILANLQISNKMAGGEVYST